MRRIVVLGAWLALMGVALGDPAHEVRLEPWEPVDPSFEGCSNGSCGTRIPNARVSVQPGASLGQSVYCPVSGVVLQVKEATPRRAIDGKPIYMCCDGCVRYFDAHRDRILAIRALGSAADAPKAE